MNRVTKIFQPSLIFPKNAVAKNQDISSKSHRVKYVVLTNIELFIYNTILVDVGSWFDEKLWKWHILFATVTSKIDRKMHRVVGLLYG